MKEMIADSLRLSVVIPVYNEEKRIIPTLKKINEYLSMRDYGHEIILVDDGSTDHTVKIVADFMQGKSNFRLLKIGKNKGKGHAIKKGVLVSKAKYIVFMDADYSTSIKEIEKCYFPLDSGYDIVIGTRRLPDSRIEVRQPFCREFMGKVFRMIATKGLGLAVTDITCGFKCFKKEVAQNIFARQRLDRWGFDAEILFLAKKMSFKIKEIPVVWSDSANSRVSLGIDTLRSFSDIIKIYIYNLRRIY